MRHVDSGRFPIPDGEQRAGSLASCFRTYGLIALPQRAGAPSNKFHGPCYESAKTATKTQMYFQQKRKCEINKTATCNGPITIAIRARFEYDSSTIQHPTRSYVLSSNNEHVNSFALL